MGLITTLIKIAGPAAAVTAFCLRRSGHGDSGMRRTSASDAAVDDYPGDVPNSYQSNEPSSYSS